MIRFNKLNVGSLSLIARTGYQDTLLPEGTPNPETRQAFAKRMIAEWLKRRVMFHRRPHSAIDPVNPDIT